MAMNPKHPPRPDPHSLKTGLLSQEPMSSGRVAL
jgi:hypothetical protein